MNDTLKKLLMSAMGSVTSHVDTREKILEVIEPLIDGYAKQYYESGYEDRQKDENLESRTNIFNEGKK